MQRLEVSCAVRRIYTSLGAEGLIQSPIRSLERPLRLSIALKRQQIIIFSLFGKSNFHLSDPSWLVEERVCLISSARSLRSFTIFFLI